MVFFVQAKDTFGNNQAYQDVPYGSVPTAFPDQISVVMSPLTVGKAVVGTYLSTPECVAPIGTTVRTICSPFRMQFLVTQSGIFELDVKINQISLVGMPMSVAVQNGQPDPTLFQVYGSGVTNLVAGIASTFSVRVQDSFGNSVNISDLDSFPLVAEIIDGTRERKCNSIPGDSTVCALELVPVNVLGNFSLGVPLMIFDGFNTFPVYSDIAVTWVATNSLASNMQLTFRKQHVASSPYNITVRTAPIQARSSIASGGGMSAAQVGDASEIVVTARDAFQNRMTDAGTLYNVQLVGPTRVRAEFHSTQVPGAIFRYTYKSSVVGTYTVSVKLGGVHLS